MFGRVPWYLPDEYTYKKCDGTLTY